METKTLLLGLLAFVVAIGSSFAPMSSYQAAWIKIKLWGSSSFTCVNTGFECDEFGPLLCKVYVETIAGPVIVPARRDIGCIMTLHESSSIPVGYYYPPYGIIMDVE